MATCSNFQHLVFINSFDLLFYSILFLVLFSRDKRTLLVPPGEIKMICSQHIDLEKM